MKKLLTTAAVVCGTLYFGTPSTAHAHLVFVGQVDLKGTGLGAVPTIMTFASTNKDVESAKISWDGTQDVRTLDTLTPAGSTKFEGGDNANSTVTLSEVGWTPNHGLGIIFNPSEPGADSNLTLQALTLTVYGATTGTVLFTAPWTQGPMTLDGKGGTGQSGYLFTLDQVETDQLDHLTLTGADHVGLEAFVTNAQGDHETFFGSVFDAGTCDDCVITPTGSAPEPATIALLGVGLLGTVALVRRRRA